MTQDTQSHDNAARIDPSDTRRDWTAPVINILDEDAVESGVVVFNESAGINFSIS